MKFPEFVKKIGTVEDECRVYVEDYVYTYLNELRERKDIFPMRAALFGHILKKEGKCFCFVYGAACVVEELENGRDEEQVRKDFFEEYELIGYVNICKDKQLTPEQSKGYYIFYETNEAMQNYLVSCYEKESRKQREKHEEQRVCRRGQQDLPGHLNRRFAGEILKKFFYGIGILVLATAVTAINDYEKMYGFMETADCAVSFAETTYRLN